MLVVDVDTLGPVHLLHLIDQVALACPNTPNLEHLLRVERTLGQLGPGNDDVAFADPQPGPARQLVRHLFVILVTNHGDVTEIGLLVLVEAYDATDLSKDRLALRSPRLEQLNNAGQTMGDVLTGDTAGVEGPHGQLRAWLTDRLSRHDPDRSAGLDHFAGGEVDPV